MMATATSSSSSSAPRPRPRPAAVASASASAAAAAAVVAVVYARQSAIRRYDRFCLRPETLRLAEAIFLHHTDDRNTTLIASTKKMSQPPTVHSIHKPPLMASPGFLFLHLTRFDRIPMSFFFAYVACLTGGNTRSLTTILQPPENNNSNSDNNTPYCKKAPLYFCL